jgi:hypothetical protein
MAINGKDQTGMSVLSYALAIDDEEMLIYLLHIKELNLEEKITNNRLLLDEEAS